MIRRPPRSTRTDTLFPYTTLFRSSPCLIVPTTECLGVRRVLGGIRSDIVDLPTTVQSMNGDAQTSTSSSINGRICMTVNQESLASSPALLAKQLQDEMDDVMRHLNSALIHAERLYSGPFSSERSEERGVGKEG